MSRSGNALHGAVWWDPHLDRAAGSPLGEVGQQRTHGITESDHLGASPGVEDSEGSRHRG